MIAKIDDIDSTLASCILSASLVEDKKHQNIKHAARLLVENGKYNWHYMGITNSGDNSIITFAETDYLSVVQYEEFIFIDSDLINIRSKRAVNNGRTYRSN